MINRLIFSIAVLTSPLVLSHAQSPSGNFAVSLASGIAYDNYRFDFFGKSNYSPVQPNFFFAASVAYGDLQVIEPTQLQVMLELSHSTVTTGSISNLLGSGELRFERTFLLVWPRLTVSGDFTPFIEAGFGIGRLKFDLTSPLNASQNNHETSQGFCFGVGGGVSLKLSQVIITQAYGQAIYLMRKVSLLPDSRGADQYSPPIFMLGLRISLLP